ncbi:MAG: GTP cyclohydrolase FolE2 [Planktomarina sp.]
MNIHTPLNAQTPTREEAEHALDVLRQWREAGGDPSLIAQTALSNQYPDHFQADADYVAGLPDLQNGPASLIRGAHASIQHVGISNFALPLRFKTRDGDVLTLETSVTGTVSLEADKKGINMSRIMRSFYSYADDVFGFDVMDRVLDQYINDLGSFDARLQLRLRYPVLRESLRSGLKGYQYYDVVLETCQTAQSRTRILHLDYVYSSTCPCSLELSEHARNTRGQLATPHAQRSAARLSLALGQKGEIHIEDVLDLCRKAVPTETQVMVKREDEQAFAELNAANPMFVEDAVRLFYEAFDSDNRIGDFRVAASHQESLHSHDAVSVIHKGPTFACQTIDPHLFASLIHVG